MIKKEDNEIKNAFNDLRMFLQLLTISQVGILYVSLRQMIFENLDASPIVAGITTPLLLMTIYHIRKLKKDNK